MKNFCGFIWSPHFFLTVDNCNIDKHLAEFLVFSLLPGTRRARDRLLYDRTFTSGSVDLRTSLFSDRRRVILFFMCCGLDREIITTKFSRSTVSYLTAVLATKPGEVTKLLHLHCIPLYMYLRKPTNRTTNPIANQLHPIRLHLVPIHYLPRRNYFPPTSNHCMTSNQQEIVTVEVLLYVICRQWKRKFSTQFFVIANSDMKFANLSKWRIDKNLDVYCVLHVYEDWFDNIHCSIVCS